jgi:CheY-like chemotaxis protein
MRRISCRGWVGRRTDARSRGRIPGTAPRATPRGTRATDRSPRTGPYLQKRNDARVFPKNSHPFVAIGTDQHPGASADCAPEKVPVLVVDDNREFAESCARLLQLAGFEVGIAYDGDSALKVAVESRPSIVLLDIGLPDIDGYEVARRLRSEISLPRFTLIAVTAYSHDEARRQAKASGFDHFIVKPMTFADLGPLLVPARQEP